jgi:hypothetical protein
LDGILNYGPTKVRFGVVEAINSDIKTLLRRGRGYKNLRSATIAGKISGSKTADHLRQWAAVPRAGLQGVHVMTLICALSYRIADMTHVRTSLSYHKIILLVEDNPDDEASPCGSKKERRRNAQSEPRYLPKDDMAVRAFGPFELALTRRLVYVSTPIDNSIVLAYRFPGFDF